VRVGVVSGLLFALFSLFPSGSFNGEQIARSQPAKTAAMEGLFHTQPNAPLAIIGMPDTEKGILLDPIEIPGVLSFLIYGTTSAKVTGLNDIPLADQPPVEIVYYAYHIMVGLGTIFIALLALSALALWRRRLYTTNALLWALMLAMPFPYIANEAGWTVSEVGRQPWIVYGLVRTADATSTNVSGGMTVFTLMGFMGLYLLIGALYVLIFMRIVHEGPAASRHAQPAAPKPQAKAEA
jgi:cytochrome d ubiquinol oxidase subunit I